MCRLAATTRTSQDALTILGNAGGKASARQASSVAMLQRIPLTARSSTTERPRNCGSNRSVVGDGYIVQGSSTVSCRVQLALKTAHAQILSTICCIYAPKALGFKTRSTDEHPSRISKQQQGCRQVDSHAPGSGMTTKCSRTIVKAAAISAIRNLRMASIAIASNTFGGFSSHSLS